MNARTISRILVALLARAGWAPALVFVLHVLISRTINVYVLFPPIDIPMHFFGGVAMAYFLSRCCAAMPEGVISPPARPFLVAVIVIGLTATASVCWEFAEFLSDSLMKTRVQLTLKDTLLDMLLGIAGGVCWVLLAWGQGRLGAVEPLEARVTSAEERAG